MDRLTAMREGGKKLGEIRLALFEAVKIGTSPSEIENLAQNLIKNSGGTPSFTTVRDYKWATCITLNNGVVHGIPTSTEAFIDGDVVMVDVGLLFEGFHTDCAFTKLVGQKDNAKLRFLQAGKEALSAAISLVKPGAYIGSISQAYQRVLASYNFTPARGLTGHGVGKTLHEEPMIPCLLLEEIEHTPRLRKGQTLALEIIYMEGSSDMELAPDGWTIYTKDGKLSAVFEETVEVTGDGRSILTEPALFQR